MVHKTTKSVMEMKPSATRQRGIDSFRQWFGTPERVVGRGNVGRASPSAVLQKAHMFSALRKIVCQ